MPPKLMILTGGILTLAMALFHAAFPRLFGWRADFAKIGTANSRTHYTIHLALLLLFVGIGMLTLVYADDLAHPTGLALGLTAMLALFWLWRTVWQVVYYRMPRGVKLRGRVLLHYVVLVAFALLTVSYAVPALMAMVH